MIVHYLDVLVDKLSKDETIFAPTERTKLKKDAKPYKATWARTSPLQYKEHTDKALKKLIREGVLKKAPPGAKFTYISLGHWVPKSEVETSFRLVTNLWRLNEAVEVETSTTPTPSEVMASIDPSHKFWVVANLTSG